MEKISKNFGIIAGIIGVMAGAAGWFFNQGANSKETQGKVFDSPEQKVEVITHVKESLTPIQERTRSIFDSIETLKTNQMLESLINDSRSIKKHIHHLDSINLLTSDQMYQIKEEIKIKHNN